MSDVLVVGGGPTGLSLASELLRHGVSCAIVEKRAQRDLHSKAISITASTLQVFDQMGAIRGFVDRGAAVRDIVVQVEHKRFFRLDYARLNTLGGVHYPYLLTLAQPDCEVLLEEHLMDRGGELRRGVTLRGLQQQDDCVVAELSSSDGRVWQEVFRYVVGCDGSRSAVRELASVASDGRQYDFSMIHADADLDGCAPRDRVHYFVSRSRFALTIPMANGQHRVVVQVHGADPELQFPEPTAADFEALLGEAGVAHVKLSRLRWVSHARIYQVLARRYRSRRVFLAGDACHQFSPIGGQGMNTGVQDAYNLAWKLAYVLRGRAVDALLDSYEAERRPIAAALLASGDDSTQLLLGRADQSAALQQLQEKLAPRVSNRRYWQRCAPLAFSGISQTYEPSRWFSETTADPVTGLADVRARAPDARLASQTGRRLFDLFRQRQHVLLVFAPPPSDARLTELLMALCTRRIEQLGVIVVGEAAGFSASAQGLQLQVLDGAEPELRARYRAQHGTLVLIRPDRYVELRATLSSRAAVLDHLDALYGCAPQLRSLSA